MKVVSLFSGAGGLDLGFEKAGFDVIWANEFDKDIWETYEKNFPNTELNKKSIRDVALSEIPDCDAIIGGPPCQSWSEAGKLRGIKDTRGQLFFEFIRILRDKKPKFFLAENVSGMLATRHKDSLKYIQELFKESGYTLSFQLLNAADYWVAQDRKRVFFIGYRDDLKMKFQFPMPVEKKRYLKDVIFELADTALPAIGKNHTNGQKCVLPNHEYLTGGFSPMYMSRNRVRSWDECSFTIQAGGRHAPIHPQAPKMQFIEQNKRIFVPNKEHLYRRLSIRECARVQTFPDHHIFYYKALLAEYKMVGNAVPPNLAYFIAKKIYLDLAVPKHKDEIRESELAKYASNTSFDLNEVVA